ncbi:unnamed protein product [Pleuronectes platessa]|uniref:Uncharacterized protein n=1 Tax=Pleuronectes platessa TaxID=8262 RepID=A0A9N7YPI0_PLEPL|nr:unnamed protein product [Pleuronectes platessa]
MPSSPAAITVHGQQPSRPRSTIQTRRHSSPQSPSTAAHQDPSRATTAVLVHRPCQMPTRQGPPPAPRSAHNPLVLPVEFAAIRHPRRETKPAPGTTSRAVAGKKLKVSARNVPEVKPKNKSVSTRIR